MAHEKKAAASMAHFCQGLSAGSGRTEVHLQLLKSGSDLQAVLSGGELPHIGATVLAVPRPSLSGRAMSCDCWITPVTAHKDHIVALPLAERLCLASGSVVAVSAGIHSDGITSEELEEIHGNCQEITDQAVAFLRKTDAACD